MEGIPVHGTGVAPGALIVTLRKSATGQLQVAVLSDSRETLAPPPSPKVSSTSESKGDARSPRPSSEANSSFERVLDVDGTPPIQLRLRLPGGKRDGDSDAGSGSIWVPLRPQLRPVQTSGAVGAAGGGGGGGSAGGAAPNALEALRARRRDVLRAASDAYAAHAARIAPHPRVFVVQSTTPLRLAGDVCSIAGSYKRDLRPSCADGLGCAGPVGSLADTDSTRVNEAVEALRTNSVDVSDPAKTEIAAWRGGHGGAAADPTNDALALPSEVWPHGAPVPWLAESPEAALEAFAAKRLSLAVAARDAEEAVQDAEDLLDAADPGRPAAIAAAKAALKKASAALFPQYKRFRPLLIVPLIDGAKVAGAHQILRTLGYACRVVEASADASGAPAGAAFDVCIAAPTRPCYSIAQHFRREVLASRPSTWGTVPEDHISHAKKLANLALSGDLVLFVGAGVSVNAGLPMWGALLTALAKQAGMSAAETDALWKLPSFLDQASIVQQRLLKLSPPIDLGDAVVGQLRCRVSALQHALLAALPVTRIVTTNYDTLFERATIAADRGVDILPYEHVRPGGPADTVPRRWLLKLHGCVTAPHDIVLTRSDYARYDDRRDALAGLLQSTLLTRHMLFVGFSLIDDNFHRIVDAVREATAGYTHAAPSETPKEGLNSPNGAAGAGGEDGGGGVGGDVQSQGESRYSEYGTALMLKEEPLAEELWRGELRFAALAPDVSDMPAWRRDAQAALRLETVLDLVGELCCLAQSPAFLLSPEYSPLLDHADRQLRRALLKWLRSVKPAAKKAPSWHEVESLLALLNGVLPPVPSTRLSIQHGIGDGSERSRPSPLPVIPQRITSQGKPTSPVPAVLPPARMALHRQVSTATSVVSASDGSGTLSLDRGMSLESSASLGDGTPGKIDDGSSSDSDEGAAGGAGGDSPGLATRGHVMIIQGDIVSLECDAWLGPAGSGLHLGQHWMPRIAPRRRKKESPSTAHDAGVADFIRAVGHSDTIPAEHSSPVRSHGRQRVVTDPYAVARDKVPDTSMAHKAAKWTKKQAKRVKKKAKQMVQRSPSDSLLPSSRYEWPRIPGDWPCRGPPDRWPPWRPPVVVTEVTGGERSMSKTLANVRKFVEYSLTCLRQLGRKPRHGRSRYLLALPVVGTGAGGMRHKAGKVVSALLPVLYSMAADERLGCPDLLLVAWDQQTFAAAQAARAGHFTAAGSVDGDDSGDSGVPSWASAALTAAEFREAERLATLALRDDLAIVLGPRFADGTGVPRGRQLALDVVDGVARRVRGDLDIPRESLAEMHPLDATLAVQMAATDVLAARDAARRMAAEEAAAAARQSVPAGDAKEKESLPSRDDEDGLDGDTAARAAAAWDEGATPSKRGEDEGTTESKEGVPGDGGEAPREPIEPMRKVVLHKEPPASRAHRALRDEAARILDGGLPGTSRAEHEPLVSPAHFMLAGMSGLRDVIVAGQDCLLQRALNALRRRFAVLPQDRAGRMRGLGDTTSLEPMQILPVSGCSDDPASLVLTRDDASAARRRQATFAGLLQAAVLTEHVTVIGFDGDELEDSLPPGFVDALRRSAAAAAATQDTTATPSVTLMWNGSGGALGAATWRAVGARVIPVPRDAAEARRKEEALVDAITCLVAASRTQSHLLSTRHKDARSPAEHAMAEAMFDLEKRLKPATHKTAAAWPLVVRSLRRLGSRRFAPARQLLRASGRRRTSPPRSGGGRGGGRGGRGRRGGRGGSGRGPWDASGTGGSPVSSTGSASDSSVDSDYEAAGDDMPQRSSMWMA